MQIPTIRYPKIVLKYLKFKYFYFSILLIVAFYSGIIPAVKHTIAWANIDKARSDTLINVQIIRSTAGKRDTYYFNGDLKSNPKIHLKGGTSIPHNVQILQYWGYHKKFIPIWYLPSGYLVLKPYYTTSKGDFLPYIPKYHFYSHILENLIFLLPFIISYLIYIKFIKD